MATLVSGEITTIAPSGEIVSATAFPDKMVTNICFGGDDLRTAYVTLSTTGKLAVLPWNEAGLRLFYN